MSTKLWVGNELFIVEEEVCDYIDQLREEIERLKAELAEQKKLWTLAAPELNANDDNSFAVRFMDLHDPIGRIDLVLKGGEK